MLTNLRIFAISTRLSHFGGRSKTALAQRFQETLGPRTPRLYHRTGRFSYTTLHCEY
jgi:hypothetical protein